jgi:hypothetical protein
LLPPQRATVAVLLADGSACDGQVNDAGRFSIAVVPAGMVRLRAVPESGLPVITEDIVL